MAGVHSRQEMMLRVLVFQARQQQTMICALENISRNTCHIYNEAKRQTGLQTDMAANLFALHHMYATANPEAALVYRRHMEDTAAREACCPPEPFRPPCEYQPCPKPEDLKREQPERYAGYTAKPSAVVRVRSQGGPD
jgi:nicotinamide mononucleotide adenylyltransferase